MEYIFDETLGCIINKAGLLLKSKLQKTLKDYDITTEQWAILCRLYISEGCNQKKIANKCLKDKAALTRILDLLEKKELVRREISPNDGREFLVSITDKGRSLYNEVLPKVIETTQNNMALFSEQEINQLKYLLNKLISSLE